MYCYSTFLFHYSYSYYYITVTAVGWCIAILRFFFTIIASPRLLSGDVLLFYVSFSLLLHHPDCCQVMYCYSTFLFHYYCITPTVVRWCIAILRFFFTIITSPRLLSGDVLLFYVSFSLLLHHPDCCRVMYCYSIILIILLLPYIFVRSISQRCLDQTLGNLVGISYAMWSCAVKGWFFQNGCSCHGNGQNAKKLKNTKMIIAGYSPNRNWWNLIGTTSTSSGTR